MKRPKRDQREAAGERVADGCVACGCQRREAGNGVFARNLHADPGKTPFSGLVPLSGVGLSR